MLLTRARHIEVQEFSAAIRVNAAPMAQVNEFKTILKLNARTTSGTFFIPRDLIYMNESGCLQTAQDRVDSRKRCQLIGGLIMNVKVKIVVVSGSAIS